MQLFHNQKNRLSLIDRNGFKLEKDIQSLVEANLEALFEVKLVSSEFAVDKFRLDSLAFDEQNNAFVIVEYKKGHSYSVVDQGYSYMSVMLNNKADFILEYNEKTGKQLKRQSIDWASSRVIFVAPSFNKYQKNSVNFRDIPFELWEIKRFDGGLVTLEQCKSSSNQSIKALSGGDSGSVISKVASEVKVISEEDLVNILDASIKPVWQALRKKLDEYSDTSICPNKGYISWKIDNSVVCYINFAKKKLRIDILRGRKKETDKSSKNFFTIDDPKGLAEKNSVKNNRDSSELLRYRINLSKEKEINYVMFLLEQKYNSMS